MMNKKRKGFSLAEMMIALLILSIVLAVAVPTVTRKAGGTREHIWQWSMQNNGAYFGLGRNQYAVLGLTEAYNTASGGTDSFFTDPENEVTAENLRFSADGDKLIIAKRDIAQTPMATSMISFRLIGNNASGGAENPVYVGRLNMDQYNLALGKGTLQSVMDESIHENVAIGHYSLFKTEGSATTRNVHTTELNSDGSYGTTGVTPGSANTSVGYKNLPNNKYGLRNTSVGARALFALTHGHSNTAIGYKSLAMLNDSLSSDENTAIGTLAMPKLTAGLSNTAVGYFSGLNFSTGYNNTLIGSGACNGIASGDRNICIGYYSGYQDRDTSQTDRLYIGTVNSEDTRALIEGRLHKQFGADSDISKAKSLHINAADFSVQTFDGAAPMFHIMTGRGGDYKHDKNKQDIHSALKLRLYAESPSNYETKSSRLEITGSKDGVQIDTFGATNGQIEDGLLAFNKSLYFTFNKKDTDQYVTNLSAPFGFGLPYGLDVIVPSGQIIKYHTPDAAEEPEMAINVGNKNIMLKDGSNVILGLNSGLSVGNKGIELYGGTANSGTLKIGNGNISASAGNGDSGTLVIGSGANRIAMYGQSGTINAQDIVLKNQYSVYSAIQGYYNSDARLKNISGENNAGLDEINKINVKNFTYKNDEEKTPHVGVIAQELQKIFPNAVTKDKDGYLMIRKEDMFYAMINSIKQLYVKIQDLTAKITGLDKRITTLEKENAQLKKQNAEFDKRLKKLEAQAAKK